MSLGGRIIDTVQALFNRNTLFVSWSKNDIRKVLCVLAQFWYFFIYKLYFL